MSLLLASVLDADWLRLREEIEAADNAGVDGFSLDIMDGSFAPPITFGPQNVAMIRNWTDLPLEVHLMVDNPQASIPVFCDTGADQILFHVEATADPIGLANYIRQRGLLAGIAVKTETPLTSMSDDLLRAVDVVNLMAVPVGFGGAVSAPDTLSRVANLRARADRLELQVAIEVDGGVKPGDSHLLSASGVDLLVIGTGIYHAESYSAAVSEARAGLAVDENSNTRTKRLISRPARRHADDLERRMRLDKLRDSLDIPRRSWDPLTSVR